MTELLFEPLCRRRRRRRRGGRGGGLRVRTRYLVHSTVASIPQSLFLSDWDPSSRNRGRIAGITDLIGSPSLSALTGVAPHPIGT